MNQIVYNAIGDGYNNTRKADPFLLESMFKYLAPIKNDSIIDIGCGTGNYTIGLFNHGLNIMGLDPSVKMLDVAKQRNSEIEWHQGYVEALPFDKDSVAGILGCLTMHHWNDLNLAFKEIARITKDQGILLFFTSTPKQMEGYWLNHYFPEMILKSIETMPSLETIIEVFTMHGIELISTEKYFIQDDLQDHFLYVGKRSPEIYFIEKIRMGISSFSKQTNIKEIAEGLAKLKSDIETGQFENVYNKYKNDRGDYLFIKARKQAINE